MEFLLTLGLALLGIVLAAGMLRVVFVGGAPSWSRAVAVTAVAVVTASGLANAGQSLKTMQDRREEWAPITPRDAIERSGGGGGVDPAFVDFAKPAMLRGETFFLSRNADSGTRLWLTYRFAPNLAEDKLADADWLVYWREPDPFKTHRLRVEDVETHLKWGPDVGLIRIRRP